MKKGILILVALCIACFTANAGKDKVISFDRLPGNSQEFVKEFFGEAKISIVKMDAEFRDTTYEVFFSDGSKVEFDRKGNWKEIDCKYGRVPEGALPAAIAEFLSRNHQGSNVVEIEKDKHDYDLKLDNRLELKFDLNGNFLRYDH